MKKFIDTLIDKLNKINNQKEYYNRTLFLIGISFASLITSIVLSILFIGSNSLLAYYIWGILISFIYLSLIYFFIKIFIIYIKKRFVFLSSLSLIIVFQNILYLLKDITLILIKQTGIPSNFFIQVSRFSNVLLIIYLVYISILVIISIIMMTIYKSLSEKYQGVSKDLKEKWEKSKNILFISLVISLLSLLILIVTPKNNTIITLLLGLSIYMLDPEIILRLFSKKFNDNEINISGRIKSKFVLYKVILYHFVISWTIVLFLLPNSENSLLHIFPLLKPVFVFFITEILLLCTLLLFVFKISKIDFTTWVIEDKNK